MTRRTDPLTDPTLYTLALVFSARSLRAENAAEHQGSAVTVARARELVAQYGARAELRDASGAVRWLVGRGGAVTSATRGGARAGAGRPRAARPPAEARLPAPRLTAEQAAQLDAWAASSGWPVATLTRRALGLEPGPWPMRVGPTGARVYDAGQEIARAVWFPSAWVVTPTVRVPYDPEAEVGAIETHEAHGPTIREALERLPPAP